MVAHGFARTGGGVACGGGLRGATAWCRVRHPTLSPTALVQVDLSKRYGCLVGSVHDIKTHPWFRPLDFAALKTRSLPPPIKWVGESLALGGPWVLKRWMFPKCWKLAALSRRLCPCISRRAAMPSVPL